MSVRRWVIFFSAVIASASFAAVALAADRTAELNEDAATYGWTGPKTTGQALVYYGYVGGPCTGQQFNRCDDTLLHVTLPEDAERGSIGVGIAGDGGDDFDLFLHASDAEGTAGEMLEYSTTPGTGGESVGHNITASGWYLVRVHYFDVEDSAYTGQAALFLPDGTKIEVTPTPTPTATATATPEPERAAAPAPGPAAAAGPPAAAPAATAALPRLVRAVLRRRAVLGRVRCEQRCTARVSAHRRGGRRIARRTVRVAPGDTVEFRLPIGRRSTRRGVVVRAVISETSGRRTTVSRAAA